MRSWFGCGPDGLLCMRSCVWCMVCHVSFFSLFNCTLVFFFSFRLQPGAPCGKVALISSSVYRSIVPFMPSHVQRIHMAFPLFCITAPRQAGRNSWLVSQQDSFPGLVRTLALRCSKNAVARAPCKHGVWPTTVAAPWTARAGLGGRFSQKAGPKGRWRTPALPTTELPRQTCGPHRAMTV